MRTYSYPYKQPSNYLVSGGRCDGMAVDREALERFWRGGLTEAGNAFIDAVFSFHEVYALECAFMHCVIRVHTTTPLNEERKVLLDRLFELMDNLQSWAFAQDARSEIIEVNQASI